MCCRRFSVACGFRRLDAMCGCVVSIRHLFFVMMVDECPKTLITYTGFGMFYIFSIINLVAFSLHTLKCSSILHCKSN